MSEQWTEETRKWLITNGLGGESLAGACRAAIHEIDRLSAEMKRLNVVLSEMASPHDLARALDKVRLADHERDRAVRAARVLIEAQGQAVKRAQAAETKLAEAQKELDEYRPNLGEVADQRSGGASSEGPVAYVIASEDCPEGEPAAADPEVKP